MTLGEKIITDRDEAAKILMTAAKGGFTAAKAVKGSYRGMNLRILIDPVAMEPYLSLSGARTYRIGFSEKPEVTMRRLDALHDGIVKELEADQATELEGEAEVRVTDVPQSRAAWLVVAVISLLVVTAWRRA